MSARQRQAAVVRDALVQGSYLPGGPVNRSDCKVLVKRGLLEANFESLARVRTGRCVFVEERATWRSVPGFGGHVSTVRSVRGRAVNCEVGE